MPKPLAQVLPGEVLIIKGRRESVTTRVLRLTKTQVITKAREDAPEVRWSLKNGYEVGRPRDAWNYSVLSVPEVGELDNLARSAKAVLIMRQIEGAVGHITGAVTEKRRSGRMSQFELDALTELAGVLEDTLDRLGIESKS